MALEDFETADSDLDLDLDEDLFDFPKVEVESEVEVEAEAENDEPQEAEYPEEVVAAAAAVQEEIDSQPEDAGIFEMDEEMLGDDLDLDELLGDEDLLGGIAGLDGELDSELDTGFVVEEELEEEEPLDFDDLLPKTELEMAKPTPAPAPTPVPVTTPRAKEAPAPAPRADDLLPSMLPPRLRYSLPAAGGFSLRTSWPIVAAILLFNFIILGLGMTAITSVTDSVDSFASRLGDVARELRDTSTPQVITVPIEVPTATDTEAASSTETAEPRVKLPPYARGELKAAQAEMDRGEYQVARRRLFRLLATIDDPLAEDAPEAEEQANLLIAETFVLESNNPQRSQG